MELRQPAVAGAFYEKDFERLERQLKGCYVHKKGPGALPISKREKRVSAIITPHAGYQYSGPCAAWAYKELAESVFPDAYLIIGTNHSGYPSTTTALNDWQTPLGVVRVDQELARSLIQSGIAQEDLGPHPHEHSIEVQLPFLQVSSAKNLDKLRFLPLMLAPDVSVKDLALDLKELLLDSGKRVTLIASGDFTHYGPNYHYIPFSEHVPQKLHDLDMGAIRHIKELNAEGFFDYVQDSGATICGHLPITLLLEMVGKATVQLLQYYTSADITGDWKNAVGYAALSFEEK